MKSPSSPSPIADQNFFQVIQSLFMMVLHVPALTVMPFMRRKIGFRLVKPWMIAGGFALILVIHLMTGGGVPGLTTGQNSRANDGESEAEIAAAQIAQAKAARERRYAEISPNAGQVSTPQTDPEAYRQAKPGYRFKREPDGTWARSERDPSRYIIERIPDQPTVIPGPTAAAIAAEAEEEEAALQAGEPWFELPSLPPVLTFGLVFLGLGIYQRWQGWKRLLEGDPDSNGGDWHTRDRGVSFIQFKPLLKLNRFQRFVEPSACIVIGYVVAGQLSTPLGFWIMFAGLCLLGVEALVFDWQLDQFCDDIDNGVEAVARMAILQRNAPMPADPAAAAGTRPPVGGAPGVAGDLEELMASRRRKRAPVDPNAAASTAGAA